MTQISRIKTLTPQQAPFCRFFMLEGNGKAAAVNAGYAPRDARQQGYKLLQQPHIARRVGELRTERHDKHKATAENVIERYRNMAMFDPTRLLILDEETGKYRSKRPDELSEEERGMVADISVTNKRDPETSETV